MAVGLRFDVREVDLERRHNSRLLKITLRCASKQEAAAMYEDITEQAESGEVKLRLRVKDIEKQ